MNRLSGKVAIITGAGSGIGREAAILFAQEGATVVVADIDDRAGEETVAIVSAGGEESSSIHCDVTDPESTRSLIEHCVDRYGQLDVLYNNAGGSTSREGPVTEIELDEFWAAIRLNLYGTFLCCRFGIPAIIASGGGAVINMSSVVAHVGTPNLDGQRRGGCADAFHGRALRQQRCEGQCHSSLRHPDSAGDGPARSQTASQAIL
jgi:NAD(P)-dependent dehydrogenase (short-subunit alcohol dehydrogenase family)